MQGVKVVWECDRCGRIVELDADPKLAESPLPLRWRRLKIDSTEAQPFDSWEICAACADSFESFMRGLPTAQAGPR